MLHFPRAQKSHPPISKDFLEEITAKFKPFSIIYALPISAEIPTMIVF